MTPTDTAAMARLQRRIRQLMRKHALARIETNVSDHYVVMRAMPATYNPVVQQRQQDAFKGRASVTLQEASDAARNALSTPLVTSRGMTIPEALERLEAQLLK